MLLSHPTCTMYHKVTFIYLYMYQRDQACLLYVYLILNVYVNMLVYKYTYTYWRKKTCPVLSEFFFFRIARASVTNKQCCSNHRTLTWIWDVGSQWSEKRSRHPCWRAWWLVALVCCFFSLDIDIQGAPTAPDSWECHTHQGKYHKTNFISIYTP